ncbi:MAG: 4-hydroxythreonine-4-phosphate dehydrogenase PdxA [Novosphingobium sp.]
MMPAPAASPLAISLGDPAGVGPELIAEAWARRDELGLPPFFVVGGFNLLTAAAESRGISICAGLIQDPRDAARMFGEALPVIGLDPTPYTPGAPDRAGATLALSSLRDATRMVAEGFAGGLVTAPIAKSKLAEVGFTHPGQTEFVAAHCGIAPDDAVMMLAGPNLRTVPLTIHVALSDVPRLVSTAIIVSKARIVAQALTRDFGIERPRIAIAALNPHAGEDGRMGHEDADIVAPAIAELCASGLDVTGPHPADALFTPRARSTYDVALCMYHDQALIPIKALDFDEGVNVTLGLPIVRTSPDHGTAFSIAGKGIADPGAMIAAIRMAGEVAARRAAA